MAACDERYAGAIALCYVQGWRVSEALGLAWQDLDLDTGAVRLRRGATYADSVGMILGPTKTRGTAGRQLLGPTGLGTHAGRRSVVTSLYASGSLDLADVARFVGHSDVSTTRGYVQHEGDRPRQVSEKALQLLDPEWGAARSSR